MPYFVQTTAADGKALNGSEALKRYIEQLEGSYR